MKRRTFVKGLAASLLAFNTCLIPRRQRELSWEEKALSSGRIDTYQGFRYETRPVPKWAQYYADHGAMPVVRVGGEYMPKGLVAGRDYYLRFKDPEMAKDPEAKKWLSEVAKRMDEEFRRG